MKVNILDCPYYSTTLKEITKFLITHIKNNGPLVQIITVNSSILVNSRKDLRLQGILKDNHNIVVCDGQPIVWASKLLKNPLPERVSGIDLMNELLCLANEMGIRVYFLGSTDRTLLKMIDNITIKYPRLNIVGYRNGYFNEEEIEVICKELSECKPDILFVAMGSPKQEYFIDRIKNKILMDVNVAIGVGGSFDVLAGIRKRAPKWMQQIGMEWFYRMIQEPRRLFKRYLYSNTMFIILIIKEICVNYFKRK
ncbi:WecB/TagA/CpsF family glycosyltransferase [Geobacillus subterraneus]|uniref:WecB/TagA/CpsF family glycosyltransferase n=1 Tax=Geobacillus subterraneus TaxID=129338 RepID=UPI001442E05D|nr:WecB/TagA/CpsF family glycosyltransferase [Geobacillus subterraneus]QIZ66042.1 WecB/TagA/CpsF family glycosyltransferase [Geobacillus subterraneus]